MRLLGASQTPSRRLPVILDPLVTRSLLALVGGALTGEAILKGRSMFVGREGEQVAAPGITLVDDPTIADAFGAATHDAEGVPTRRVDARSSTACSPGSCTTCTPARARRRAHDRAPRCAAGSSRRPVSGARALHLLPGALTRRGDPRVGAATALYVQSVSGLHSGTNPVSGDFSVGAEGLIVRDGEFAEPVREVTIASTLPAHAARRRPRSAATSPGSPAAPRA